jgi:hypothetical protein
MRAILIIVGVMLMPWLDDMKAVSAALAAQPVSMRQGDAIQEQKRELGDRTTTIRAAPNEEMINLDMERFYQRAMDGEITMDEAVRQFREKWFGGTPPDIKDHPGPGGLEDYYSPGGLGDKLNWPKRK